MRRFFFSLLIVIIAFRGMVGDVMAVGMASAPMQSSEQAQHVMPCHDAAETDDQGALFGQCKTCQVCHLSACLTPSITANLDRLSIAAPLLRSESFASAEALRASKPPIL
jgi:hypothetical protein